MNLDLPQQPLNIRSHDPFGRELLGHHLPVQERDRQQVGKRVVGLLFRADLLLCAFLAAADDVVGDLEGLQLHTLDVARIQPMCFAQLERRLERRLRVDLGVVALEEGASDTLEVLAFPIDLERAGDRVHETFVALEYLERAGDPTGSEKDGPDGAECGEWIGHAFPLRQSAGARYAQGVQRGSRDRDCVRRLRLVQTQGARRPGGGRICALRGVIESFRAYRCLV